MTQQPTLFPAFNAASERAPLARRTDPASSHEAAAQVTASGVRDSQCAAVLDALRRHPGSTSLELATASGLDRYVVARRLPELERDGRAVRGELRLCRASGGQRRAVTWRATGPTP